MRRYVLALMLGTLPGALAAQTTGQITAEGGVFSGDPDALFRLHADGLMQWGTSGVQIAGTYGSLAGNDTLTDLRLIAFQDIGTRWRYGVEVQSTTGAVLGGADYLLGFRLRYADAGGTVDTRFALAQNGLDGAFSVTVAMDQALGSRTRAHGMLHRYSTNSEMGDFFAIGLGGEADLRGPWGIYTDALWSLSDDFSTETLSGTLGLRRGPYFAGISGWDVNGTGAIGLSAGITLSLDGADTLFETDPWGLQMAQIGH